MHFGEQRKQQHVPLERPRSTNFQCLGGRALLPSWGDTSSASNLSTWGSAQMMAPYGPYQTRSWILFQLVHPFNWYTVARLSMKFQLHETGNPISNGSVKTPQGPSGRWATKIIGDKLHEHAILKYLKRLHMAAPFTIFRMYNVVETIFHYPSALMDIDWWLTHHDPPVPKHETWASWDHKTCMYI